MKTKNIIFCFGLFYCCWCFQSFSSIKVVQKQITQAEGILLAETFIIENGYTAFKPNKSKLKLEGYETDIDIDEVLKMRYNKFHEKAFCISIDERGYHIGFLSKSVDVKRLSKKQKGSDLSGRSVLVSYDGKEIYMMHKDPRFSFFTKL